MYELKKMKIFDNEENSFTNKNATFQRYYIIGSWCQLESITRASDCIKVRYLYGQ